MALFEVLERLTKNQVPTVTIMTPARDMFLAIVASCSGLLLHWFCFRHGEWDTAAPSLLFGYGMMTLASTCVLSGRAILVTAAFHLFGVWASMLLYRMFFHRLSDFPGPCAARLSNFYVTFLSAKKLRLYEETQRLHGKYGDYVRLGELAPNTLSPTS